ncbi:albumin-binding GA domain-containing protein [Anaerococcus hydrogenalis]|uniref:albumin-binding GA domain-containing protein n=1 Tax=Anaerococcus hydrogenalis TaxID=33029 RepID=UPI0023F2962C|nr:albumin-binding GA domain-containing protein [Anaerococcus hydrogenalis]
MNKNKKFVLGSAIALALSVGVVAPNLSKADQVPQTALMTTEQAKNLEAKKAEAKKENKNDAEYQANVTAQKSLYDLENYLNKYKNDATVKNLAAAKAAAKAELANAGIDKSQYEKEIDAAKTVYDVDQVKTRLLKNAPKRTTIDDFNLNEAKKEAKAKLEEMGIQNPKLYEQVEKARSVEVINDFMAKVEKSHEESSKPKMTLDQWNELENYKKAAIDELQKKGIGEKHSAEIKDAKTKYDVDAIKEKILKNAPNITTIDDWLKGQDKKPEVKPSDDKKPEEKPSDDKKPEVKPSDDKKPEAKPSDEEKPSVKPSDDKKPEEKTKEGKKSEGSKEAQNKKSDDKKVQAKKSDDKKVVAKNQAPANNAQVKKVNNVNTGVAGLTGVVATLAAASAALFKSKRK